MLVIKGKSMGSGSKNIRRVRAGMILLALCLPTAAARADDYTLTIRDHKFSPATLEIPANQKVRIAVVNADPTPEEFESYELNREKVVDGNSRITVFIGPLDPGTYPYFGDFHRDMAQGKIVVK
jgi:hypothetical protein